MSKEKEWWEEEEPKTLGEEEYSWGKPRSDVYTPDPINQIGRLSGVPIKPGEIDGLYHGTYSVRKINEALGQVYGATAYLLGTRLTRTEEDKIRAILLATVEHKKVEYHMASDRGGYRFDREQLWNNYFQGQKALKKILDLMEIVDLETLETKYATETDKRPWRRIKGRFPF